MSAVQLVQLITQVLFILIFVVVVVQAVQRPRRATIDSALLFGVVAIIIAQSWVSEIFHTLSDHLATATLQSLLMALPYLLVRLVDDFSDVPRLLIRGAEIFLGLSVISFFVLPAKVVSSVPLTLLYVLDFVGLLIYVAWAFIVAARHSNGVTKRRMRAVAAGSTFLGADILLAVPQIVFPHASVWTVISSLCALGSGLMFFLGFAPPPWLRRAWQEPEVRAFLGRAAHLPRLPDTRSIIRELERGAALSIGTPHAAIALWDAAAAVLRTESGGVLYEAPSGDLIGGQAFATQQPLFWPDTSSADPQNAQRYERSGATSVMAVPITAGSTRLGVLMVYASRPSIFAEDDLMLVQLLADQAAVILESRTLIDEAARVRAHEESTRLKDDFLSAAAHDLKTPLTALIAQAQFMERRARRDPAAPADLAGLQRMVAECQRLKHLVLDLLDVSRVEQGKLVGQRTPVDLVPLVRDIVRRHATALHPCQLIGDDSVSGLYDHIRIAQVFDNLLDNAIKYSPAGGKVVVRIWHERGEACVTVTDQGIGIPAADLPHLFERFHRGQNVDDRKFAGMGLGLYICRGVIEEHDGRIWATSGGLGTGSTMHVMLPLSQTSSNDMQSSDNDGSGSESARVKVETA